METKTEPEKKEPEKRLTPKEVADDLRVLPCTVLKWIHHGYRGITLRADCVGGRYRTYQSWVNDFLKAVNESKMLPAATDEQPSDRGPSAADKRLAELGM
jgi:hypothetical protein